MDKLDIYNKDLCDINEIWFIEKVVKNVVPFQPIGSIESQVHVLFIHILHVAF